MTHDPIVEEIHQIRKRIWEECGGDFQKYLARLRKTAAVPPDRMVTLERRRKETRAARPE